MALPTLEQLLSARVHLGHLASKWHPHFAPYLLAKHRRRHVIDLHKTLAALEEAQQFMAQLLGQGKKILFVATKRQAKHSVAAFAEALEQPHVTQRWMGGLLTNFSAFQKRVKLLERMRQQEETPTYQGLTKREQLILHRKNKKLTKVFDGIRHINRLPAAVFVVDVRREHTAVQEARKLGLPVVALIDTHADPRLVQYPIPANDDARAAIDILLAALQEPLVAAWQAHKASPQAAAHQVPHGPTRHGAVVVPAASPAVAAGQAATLQRPRA